VFTEAMILLIHAALKLQPTLIETDAMLIIYTAFPNPLTPKLHCVSTAVYT